MREEARGLLRRGQIFAKIWEPQAEGIVGSSPTIGAKKRTKRNLRSFFKVLKLFTLKVLDC